MNPTYEYNLNSLPASDLVPDNLDTSSEDYHRQFQSASSNSTRDHSRYPLWDAQQQQQQRHQQVDNISSHVALYDEQEINLKKNGFMCPKWNLQEHENGNHHSNGYPVKWMSSKMRLMQKMRNYTDWEAWEIPSCGTALKFEDQTQSSSSAIPFGRTDMISSNNSSNKSNNNPIIRVCADCNTTKTPLWRSGPQGPRSLCNACGIRQRKARRAMAAAAAAAEANGQIVLPTETSAVKTKAPQHKEKLRIKNRSAVQNNKKRIKLPVGSSSSLNIGQKKTCFEDFLTSLRKSLSFHQVFPQDEKEAAILLMALSSGLALG